MSNSTLNTETKPDVTFLIRDQRPDKGHLLEEIPRERPFREAECRDVIIEEKWVLGLHYRATPPPPEWWQEGFGHRQLHNTAWSRMVARQEWTVTVVAARDLIRLMRKYDLVLDTEGGVPVLLRYAG